MTTVAIHQPEYLPCLALVAKITRSDVLVLLDDVQFSRASLQQRARVAAPDGALSWLTIPFVHAFPQRIDGVRVADTRWPARHGERVRQLYARAPGFRAAWASVGEVFDATGELLLTPVVRAMACLLTGFGVATPTTRASMLGCCGDRGAHVLAICRAMQATTYLAGARGAEYLDRQAFRAAGIEIQVSRFSPPDYGRPLPLDAHARGLSGLDALCYLGEDAPRWLMQALDA